MPPRRSHKKSRAGCRRCKSRKIKCDEIHPRCGNCVKHGVVCDFEYPEVADDLQPVAASTPRMMSDLPGDAATPGLAMASMPSTPATSSAGLPPQPPPFDFQSPLPSVAAPSPAAAAASLSATLALPLFRPLPTPLVSSTTPSVSRLLELRLLHQYTTETCRTLALSRPDTIDIWRDTVPNLAFAGSEHLTDAVLAVAALHLRSLAPNDKDLVRASHAYMASSLREYSASLKKGEINASNAEALFLTSTLIAFQSTATRIFSKDDLSFGNADAADSIVKSSASPGGYGLPLSWFRSFQGVKAITAASWPWLRNSGVVIRIIDSQPVLQLDLDSAATGFFGHLLQGLDEELAELSSSATSSASSEVGQQQSQSPAGGPAAAAFMGSTANSNGGGGGGGSGSGSAPSSPEQSLVASTRQAYEHAVAVLNWAHKIPNKGAPLAFPATVSRRFVELLEARKPRALAVLACFFALLKSLDTVWWLQGMARREVLGVVSLFNSDLFSPEVERRWWPHLEWAVRVALFDDAANPGYVPPELWGTSWLDDDAVLAQRGSQSFVTHIEMLTQMVPGFEHLAQGVVDAS